MAYWELLNGQDILLQSPVRLYSFLQKSYVGALIKLLNSKGTMLLTYNLPDNIIRMH